MGLNDYNKKRDFNTTPEPDGKLDASHGNRFVIQRHDASHLHYDLRLEMDGVLKSWAVPKGPSMNVDDKRLAVQTEDHPIKYLTFQGTIPKGNYGAGTMTIWDHGVYFCNTDIGKDYKKGKLTISFSGNKLKGLFTLVKTAYQGKQNQWLFMKKPDAYAVSEDYDSEIFVDAALRTTKISKTTSLLNTTFKPMLASPSSEVFNSPQWIYELKYDGYRVIAHIKDGVVKLQSRNGIALNEKFSEIVKELQSIPHDAVLDGEVVYVTKNGIPKFQELQNYPETTVKGNLQYMVFDLVYLNGHNTIELPLLDRKRLLKDVIEENPRVFYCDHIEAMGTAFYEKSIAIGMEGIIAKKADSTYDVGYRSEDWLKIKPTTSSEALICGYTLSEKAARPFGSIILGMYDKNQLVYVGNCGSGFSQAKLKQLKAQFEPLVIPKCPFKTVPNLKGRKAIWMQPLLLCEVKFAEWTKDHHMRHPVFVGLRTDKETPDKITTVPESTDSQKPVHTKAASEDNTLSIGGIDVALTNLDKVYWPETPFLKYDLIDYYIKVGHIMLPYLVNRPQNLHRHPNGITKESFYQKNTDALPDWVKTIKLNSKSTEKEIDYLLCQNEATLIFMANLGCIEINPWHSTIDHLNHPDYTVIDLDPSPKNTFKQIIETALIAHAILKKAHITSFCKTSGSRGLHIYIPLGHKYTYKEAVNFTKLICILIQEQLPKLTTMERSLKKRGPKIYLDYLQNRKGQTIVAPYSARPKVGATVSTPVTWEEVEKGFEMADFTIKSVPDRVDKVGDLFDGLFKNPIDMAVSLNLL